MLIPDACPVLCCVFAYVLSVVCYHVFMNGVDSQLIFLDLETTGLDPRRHVIWEAAWINNHGEHAFAIDLTTEELRDASPIALEVGRYRERVTGKQGKGAICFPRENVARKLADATAGKHIVGANPAFDAAFLTELFRKYDLKPQWHYHLIDIEAVMLGVLAAKGSQLPVPWNSVELGQLVGVAPPKDNQRHTALGDTRWVKSIWEKVTQRAVEPLTLG